MCIRDSPYVTDGKKNAKVPKDIEPISLSLEQSIALLEAAPARGARRGKKKTRATSKKKASTKKKASISEELKVEEG